MSLPQAYRARFTSLGSGSSGNATLIAGPEKGILVDCGFSAKEALSRMARIGFAPENLMAIIVTHEHGDHAKGVGALSRKLDVPVYASRGTCVGSKFDRIERLTVIRSEESFQIEDFQIHPITVPHDAREPLQFVLERETCRVGVLTDLGSLSRSLPLYYDACDALLIEANHDLEMLSCGPYPLSLQRRVGGPWGHLNNQQTAQLLESLDLSRIQQLVVGHISMKNNALDRVKASLARAVEGLPSVHYATQDTGFGWLHIR